VENQRVQSLISEHLKEAHVIVSSDDNVHFQAIIICPSFEGKTQLQRQQMVYQTVSPQLKDGSIHALTMETHTPEEWQQLRESSEG